MIISTWNVNSIKVRLHAVIQYLSEEQPDVLVLQETKCIDDNFPIHEIMSAGYHSVFCGQQKYNGVAILSKQKAKNIIYNPVTTDLNETRSISATFNNIQVLNLYVVNGHDIDSEKYAHKLSWLNALILYVKQTLQNNKNILILGDFNIAPTDRDVFDSEASRDKILCSNKERALLSNLLSLGFTDLFNNFNFPDNTFSWWDYRAGSFQRNAGYRIDLILSTKDISQRCYDYKIDSYTRHKSWCLLESRTSDHAPVRIKLK